MADFQVIAVTFSEFSEVSKPSKTQDLYLPKTRGSTHHILPLATLCQLGGVVVAVTVLSILGAIVTLPAALMLVPSLFHREVFWWR